MTVTAVKEGLRVDEVYDGSPAKQGGLKVGRRDRRASTARSLAGQDVRPGDDADQGPGGLVGDARRLEDGAQDARRRSSARRSTSRSSQSEDGDRRRQEDRLGAAGELHRPARTTTSATRSTSSSRQGAQGVVLDLRDNGGGLLNEAVPDRLDLPPRRARSSRPRAATGPSTSTTPTGGAISTQDPGRRAGRRRLGVGVGDRHRRAAGPQAREGRRHAHVRQGRLPGDRAAVQRRRAGHHGRRVLHADRAQPRRRRRAARAPASRRTSRRSDDPKTEHGRGARRRRWRRWPAEWSGARRRRCWRSTARSSRSTPFFERGNRIDARQAARGERVGDLVRRAAGRRARRARQGRAADRAPGRRARRARGADARPRAAAALRPAGRARGADRGRGRRADEARRDLRELPTFTIDPPTARTSTTRSRPRRSTTARCASGSTSPTSRAFVKPGSARRPRGVPARELASTCPGLVEPMLPEALSNRACSLVPGRGPADGHRRARVRGREGAPHRVPPLA